MADEIIPQYKTFNGKRYRRAGATKNKTDAKKRAESMRLAGWNVRTVKIVHPRGTRYANYRVKT